MKNTAVLSIALLMVSVFQAVECVAAKLQKYNVTANETSLSGFSSGAYMAVQFHVSYSKIIKGAGITAGGPFYCAEGSFVTAQTSCADLPFLISVPKLITLTETDAAMEYIDPTSYLKGSRVLLMSGTKDIVVAQGVMDKLEDYYSHFVKTENIAKMFSLPAGHSQLSDDYGGKCDTAIVWSPYIINCDYPAGFKILDHIYYNDNITYANDSAMIEANLIEFNQSEFFHGSPSSVSMDTTGYVYVPSACQRGAACRLHIAFHGCLQSRGSVGNAFALHGGYNGVGERNNIIILYPQAMKTLTNPAGCWDWWGYTGPNYGLKDGLQMLGIKSMLDRIAK